MREAIFPGSVDPTRISQLDVPMVAAPHCREKEVNIPEGYAGPEDLTSSKLHPG